MRLPIAGTMLVLCACASGGKSAPDQSALMHEHVEYTRIVTPNGIIQIDWERTFDDTKLLVTVDKAWAAIPAVFGELGIEPGVVDAKQHVFGNAGEKFRGRLGQKRLSHYFDCGSMAGISNADNYDVVVRVISQVVPTAGGLSMLRTQVEGTARATAVSSTTVRCASTGQLEARIANMLSEQASRAGD
jgi:hypothetical protein